jgi:two-component system, OmpR family, heavy metal sensor histidine kinase CusS
MSSTTAAERSRPRRWSLAARLTVWYAGSAFGLVALASGALYWALAGSLDREDDEFLEDQVRILRTILRQAQGDLASLREEVEVESSVRRSSRVFLRVIFPDGTRRFETPGMGAVLAPAVFPEPVPATGDPPGGAVVAGGDGEAYRVVAALAPCEPSARGECLLQVAVDRTREASLLADYRRRLWLVLATALVACTAAGYAVARRGIRPVSAIGRAARSIGSSTLDRRIDLADLPVELAELASTFNDMLARIDDAFGRLSRFSADIAHELRSPVAALRGGVEVALGRARTAEEYREVLGSALEECDRLARTIDSLLFVARAESPEASIDRVPLDVGAELRTVREFYEAAAAEAGVALRVEGEAPMPAELDRTLLQRAVGNLVANALAHTPRGGTVTLAARLEGPRNVRIEVADTGHGIASEHLPHLFERLYRVDRARPRGAGGVGLGLAIVRSIADLHCGTATIESEPDRGTRVSLVLPLRAERQSTA